MQIVKKQVLLWGVLLVFNFLNAQTQISSAQQQTDTKKAVETFFMHLGEKNPEKIANCFTENIDWYIFESKEFPWTGKRTKRSEIPEVFKTLFSYFVDGEEKFQMESFLVDGNEAAVFAQLGRKFIRSGKSFTMLIAIHFTVENGLISKFYLYEQTPILEKAYLNK